MSRPASSPQVSHLKIVPSDLRCGWRTLSLPSELSGLLGGSTVKICGGEGRRGIICGIEGGRGNRDGGMKLTELSAWSKKLSTS